MKHLIKFLCLSAIVFLSGVSCSKIQECASSSVLELKVSSSDSKLVFHDNKVQWASADKVFLFAADGTMSLSDECGVSYDDRHVFTFSEWPVGKTPSYVLYNFSNYKKAYSDAAFTDGSVSAILPDDQRILNVGSFAQYACVSVGPVSGSESSFSSDLRNAVGMLKFEFGTDEKITSVIISSVEGVNIAGQFSISASSIEAGNPDCAVVSGKKQITLHPDGNAAADGAFIKDSVEEPVFYMAGVLPSTFTPVLTLTRADGYSAVRTGSKSLTIERNHVIDLGYIDKNAEWFKPELPDEFELDLAFYNESNENPLGSFNSTQDATSGEIYSYTYNYTYKGASFSAEMPFTVCKGTTDGSYYSYATHSGGTYGESDRKVFINAKNNGWIKLPAVEGRYLQKVSLTIGNTNKKIWVINDEPDSSTPLASANAQATSEALATGETEFTALSETKPEVGKPYYIYLSNGASLNIYDLRVTYTKALPIKIGFTATSSNPFEGIDNTYKSKTVDPDEFTYTAGGQTYTFVSQGAYYAWSNSQGLWAQAAGYLKVPTISGYKLSKIYMQGGNAAGKPWQIYSKEGEGDYVSVGSKIFIATSDKGEATGTDADNCKLEQTWTLNDEYSSSKDYYIKSYTTNQLLAKFILTYVPKN